MSGRAYKYRSNLLQVAGMMGDAAILEKPFRWDKVKRALEKALRLAEADTLVLRRSYTPHPATA